MSWDKQKQEELARSVFYPSANKIYASKHLDQVFIPKPLNNSEKKTLSLSDFKQINAERLFPQTSFVSVDDLSSHTSQIEFSDEDNLKIQVSYEEAPIEAFVPEFSSKTNDALLARDVFFPLIETNQYASLPESVESLLDYIKEQYAISKKALAQKNILEAKELYNSTLEKIKMTYVDKDYEIIISNTIKNFFELIETFELELQAKKLLNMKE